MKSSTHFRALTLLVSALGVAACSKNTGDKVATDSGSAAAAAITPSGAAQEVEVAALDYAFSMPDSVNPGRTAFRLRNQGKVFHEYNVVLLKEGATLQQFIDAENKDLPTADIVDGPLGVLFAEVGSTSPGLLSADLKPGRTYAVQCIFRDSATAPTHRALGMFKSFAVRNMAAAVVPAVAVDTIVGTDYAYTKYPRTLAPGWHHFVFVNAGKQQHEISISALKKGVTLPQLMAVASDEKAAIALLDGDMGVLHARSGVTPYGTLDFEVLPDREYIVICTFSDTPKSPPHFALGMVTSMVSTK